MTVGAEHKRIITSFVPSFYQLLPDRCVYHPTVSLYPYPYYPTYYHNR